MQQNSHFQPSTDRAFTLLELIIVIAIISTMLVFAIPNLDISPFSNQKRKISTWIILTVNSAKDKAQKEQIPIQFNVDMDNNKMWISYPISGLEMTGDAGGPLSFPERAEISSYEEEAFLLPKGYRLMGIEFPGNHKISTGTAVVSIYPKGYSDQAILHVEHDDREENLSYRIEPFLPTVKMYEEYLEYE